MLKISYAACIGLSPAISMQFTVIAKNSLKPFILGIQGRSKSLMLIVLKNLSLVLVMICSNSVLICNRTIRATSGKMTSF